MITLQHSFLSLNFISSPDCCCGYCCSVGIGRLMIFTALAQPKATCFNKFTFTLYGVLPRSQQTPESTTQRTLVDRRRSQRSLTRFDIRKHCSFAFGCLCYAIDDEFTKKSCPTAEKQEKTSTGRPKTRFPKLARINSKHENFNLFNHIYFSTLFFLLPRLPRTTTLQYLFSLAE